MGLQEGTMMPSTALAALLDYVKTNDRICPRPDYWEGLCKILRRKAKEDGVSDPPTPLILAGWWASSNLDKIVRLRDHLEFAEARTALKEADRYLRGLREEDWHHLGD
jgi:hypothetical protein